MPERHISPLKRFLTSKKLMRKSTSLHSIIATLIPMILSQSGTFRNPEFPTQNSERERITVEHNRKTQIRINISISINEDQKIR